MAQRLLKSGEVSRRAKEGYDPRVCDLQRLNRVIRTPVTESPVIIDVTDPMPFQDWKVGMLVRRSDHQLREVPGLRPEVGVVVEVETYKSFGKDERWPHIHWQNAPMATITHPKNATPVSNAEVLALYEKARQHG